MHTLLRKLKTPIYGRKVCWPTSPVNQGSTVIDFLKFEMSANIFYREKIRGKKTNQLLGRKSRLESERPVSYTHLTLPTKA